MVSLIGALIGFAGSAVPSVIDHFKAKQTQKTQIEILRIQGELAKAGSEMDLLSFQEKASDNEHRRLIEHDIAMQSDTGFMAGLRKSVRPLITYLFFAIFAAVKIAGLNDAMDNNDFNTAINIVWDTETKAIFAAIISFWFGSRALEKRQK